MKIEEQDKQTTLVLRNNICDLVRETNLLFFFSSFSLENQLIHP